MAENYSPIDQEVQKDFQKWFGDPVDPEPEVAPFSSETDWSYHRIERSSTYTQPKLLGLFKPAILGGGILGLIVGAFIVYLNSFRWYSNSWPDPIVFISIAMGTGFIGGLYKGLFSKFRK